MPSVFLNSQRDHGMVQMHFYEKNIKHGSFNGKSSMNCEFSFGTFDYRKVTTGYLWDNGISMDSYNHKTVGNLEIVEEYHLLQILEQLFGILFLPPYSGILGTANLGGSL